MNPSLRKISLLILMIIVLPVLIFSVFEIGSLRQNEKEIQNIYKNQLDAILFSINQYSNDILSNLASRVENSSNNPVSRSEPKLNSIIGEVPSLKCILQFNQKFEFLTSLPDSFRDSTLLPDITGMVKSNTQIIQQLQTFLKSGYRKIENLGKAGKMQGLVFLTEVKDEEIINVLIIDPDEFISKVLDPRIQEIAKGYFHIAAYHAGDLLPFYTSNKKYNPGMMDEKAPFWLLKDYQMGIELKDATIADLTRDRVKKNLILIGIMDVILLFGAFMIFRNVSKQIELSQLKSDFVSGVSHEIRTPLAIIAMYVETLEMGRIKSDEKIREYYSVILNETTRLSSIVNRILSFSQIENNKRKYSFNETALNEIVENAAASLRLTMETKGFKYTFIPENDLPLILADREAVTDAFVNLIDNAMKYSTDIKTIDVRTGKYESFVYVEVKDKGIGISEKNQKFIFDKFFRVTETNLANKVKGSGLGLAIVKHIIEAHHGKIYIKSDPGNGSLLDFPFPSSKIDLYEKNINC